MVGKVNPQYAEDFEMLYAEAVEVLPEYEYKDDKGCHLLRFPIFVTFETYDGRVGFRSEFLFTFDLAIMGLHDGVEFIRCVKRVIKPPPELLP